MIININDTIVLDDDKEYVVASKAVYENKKYYYLIDLNDEKNIKFCYDGNNSIFEISDKELITKLLPMFLGSVK